MYDWNPDHTGTSSKYTHVHAKELFLSSVDTFVFEVNTCAVVSKHEEGELFRVHNLRMSSDTVRSQQSDMPLFFFTCKYSDCVLSKAELDRLDRLLSVKRKRESIVGC